MITEGVWAMAPTRLQAQITHRKIRKASWQPGVGHFPGTAVANSLSADTQEHPVRFCEVKKTRVHPRTIWTKMCYFPHLKGKPGINTVYTGCYNCHGEPAVIVVFCVAELREIISACDLNIEDTNLQSASDLETTTLKLDCPACDSWQQNYEILGLFYLLAICNSSGFSLVQSGR